MIYADINVFNKNKRFDVKINETATGETVVKQLSRILKTDCNNLYVLNKRTGSVVNNRKTLREQHVRGGDTLILVLTNDETVSSSTVSKVQRDVVRHFNKYNTSGEDQW